MRFGRRSISIVTVPHVPTTPKKTRRGPAARIGIVFVVVLLPILFLSFRCAYDPEVFYLTAHSGAEWISWRPRPDLRTKIVNRYAPTTRFIRECELSTLPSEAQLEIRALQTWRLRVNDVEIQPAPSAGNWKSAQSVAIGHALELGANRIEVTVRCEGGPPSLWLRSPDLPAECATGPGWVTQSHRGHIKPAVLSTTRFLQPHDDTPVGAPVSARLHLRLLGGLFIAAALAFMIRERVANWTSSLLPTRVRELASAPNLTTLVATAGWLAVAFSSASKNPEPIGFDVTGHLEYIDLIASRYRLPLAPEGWSTYHPPLFYVLSALVRSAFGGAELSLKLLPFAAGLAQLVLARIAARLAFPSQPSLQAVTIAIAAMIPMNLYIAQFLTNEGMTGFLIGLTICYAIHLTEREHPTKQHYAMLGVFAGLALLTKYTALVSFAAIAFVLAADQLGKRRDFRRVATALGAFVGTTLLVSGWFYARNFVRLGTPLPGNWHIEVWQDPGVLTSAYWTRLGGWISNPFMVGLNSFSDSIYATFWGDALLSGTASENYGSYFNQDLIAAVMLVATPAIVFFAVGVLRALTRIVRDGSTLWSLVLLPAYGLFAFIAYAILVHPAYAVAKAFFALGALVPVALTIALGFQFFDELASKRAPALRVVLYAWLGTLGGAVFMTYLR